MNCASILAGAVSVFAFSTATAAEIKVLASGATKEIIEELVPSFEKTSGDKVLIAFTGTANIKKQIAGGEVYDLVIVGASVIDSFVQQGKVKSGSRTNLMKSGIGVAVRTGAPKPNIASGEAIKATLLAVKSIGYSSGPSGEYVIALIQRMGIADQTKSKLKQVPSGERIATLLENGEAEIGFQQISELIHATGIDYIGPLPSDVQKITMFSAGIHTAARDPEAAAALVKALTAPEAAVIMKKHGMEPG